MLLHKLGTDRKDDPVLACARQGRRAADRGQRLPGHLLPARPAATGRCSACSAACGARTRCTSRRWPTRWPAARNGAGLHDRRRGGRLRLRRRAAVPADDQGRAQRQGAAHAAGQWRRMRARPPWCPKGRWSSRPSRWRATRCTCRTSTAATTACASSAATASWRPCRCRGKARSAACRPACSKTAAGSTAPAGCCRSPTFRHDPAAGTTVNAGLAPPASVDLSGYEAIRGFATARDGTKVPLSIVARKGLKRDGRNPTLVAAYGAYQVTSGPYFSLRTLAFLERGGVFCDRARARRRRVRQALVERRPAAHQAQHLARPDRLLRALIQRGLGLEGDADDPGRLGRRHHGRAVR